MKKKRKYLHRKNQPTPGRIHTDKKLIARQLRGEDPYTKEDGK